MHLPPLPYKGSWFLSWNCIAGVILSSKNVQSYVYTEKSKRESLPLLARTSPATTTKNKTKNLVWILPDLFLCKYLANRARSPTPKTPSDRRGVISWTLQVFYENCLRVLQRAGSTLKNTCKFSPQHPRGCSQLSKTLVQEAQHYLLTSTDNRRACGTYRQNIHS